MATFREVPSEVPRYRQGYLSPGGIRVQYTKEWAKHHPLEGDGLRPLLFFHLWRKNKGSESWLKNLLLPDTVVYEHNFPRAWYTYDVESKEINKYPGKMLDAQSIYQQLGKATPGCDIVAQFLTMGTPEEQSPRDSGGAVTYVEYFSSETLRDFLFGHTRKPDGILQRFVLPKGETTTRRNFLLQVSWSPLATVVYKRTNRHRLDDHQVPLHLRAATFDGDRHLSELTLVADETKARLGRLCREVVDHIYYTDRKLITRLVVTLKVDDDNRPWLLWCSAIRISGDSLNPTTLYVPANLSARVEIVNDGSSTRDRTIAQRDRQRQLLAMDRQLFELSRDYEFGIRCNASHMRQARRLGLAPDGKAAGRVAHHAATPHPLREATRAFSAASAQRKSTRRVLSQKVPTDDGDETNAGEAAPVLAEEPAEKARSELTALALDAWYSVYSSVLAENPSVMATRTVELSEPILALLRQPELERLAVLIGLIELPQETETQEQGTASGAQTATGIRAMRRFVVRQEILASGRRLDRPLINVERDVREFFGELFQSRGEEITREFLENERWQM